MLNHVHKTTVNSLSDSLSLFHKDSFAFSLLLLPALTHSCTHKLFGDLSPSLFQSIAPYCTNTAIPPRGLSRGDLRGFGGSEAEAHTWAAVCVWEGFDQRQGEQPSGGGCRMRAVIIEEGVGLGASLLRHTSTAKNKHLLISSPPPPHPNHCLLPVDGLTKTIRNMGSGNRNRGIAFAVA